MTSTLASLPCLRRLACTCALSAGLALPLQASPQGTSPAVGPGVSPVVTWDAAAVYGSAAQAPTLRKLQPAELQRARQRASQFFDALLPVPEFSHPRTEATYLTSFAVVEEPGRVLQEFVAYASNPRDVRRRADGALWGVMGGSHRLLFMYLNRPPGADKLAEREHNAYARQVGLGETTHGYFVAPRTWAEVGGGRVHGGYLVITRDGQPALVPAPLGTLLQADIATHRKTVADLERGWAASLRELAASMTPEAIVARRAKREARWKTETRDPAALARRLDAAERTDEVDTERQRERMTPPEQRDPKSVYWGPRLALQTLEQQLASLDAGTAQAAACGWRDTRFHPGQDVRWAAAGPTAPAGCLPMVQIRTDLLAGPGAADDPRLFTAWLGEEHCGQFWHADIARLGSMRCQHHLPLLRGLDWAALRRSWGW